MSTGLIDIMKRAATDANEASNPCDLRYGTVVSVSPLSVQVSHHLIIPESLLLVPQMLTDFEVSVSFNWETEEIGNHTHTCEGNPTSESGKHLHDLLSDGDKKMIIHNGLCVGDRVVMIRQKGGQKYVILDRAVVKK